jgi:hypothetical protein
MNRILPNILSKSVLIVLIAAGSLAPFVNTLAQTKRAKSKHDFSKNLVAQLDANNAAVPMAVDIDTECDVLVDDLTTEYIATVLQTSAKIKPFRGTKKYGAVVRSELGRDAPVFRHCVRGQYASLQKAIENLGVDEPIIPSAAANSTITFCQTMTAKYPQFTATGTLYKDTDAFIAALTEFLAKNPAKNEIDFMQNNINLDDVAPGSILILPSPANRGSGRHAVLYIGRGNFQDAEFVQDHEGEPHIAGFNRESVAKLFNPGQSAIRPTRTSRGTIPTFVASIPEIAGDIFKHESAKIAGMTRAEMLNMLADGDDAVIEKLEKYDDGALRQFCYMAYFGREPKLIMPFHLMQQEILIKIADGSKVM